MYQLTDLSKESQSQLEALQEYHAEQKRNRKSGIHGLLAQMGKVSVDSVECMCLALFTQLDRLLDYYNEIGHSFDDSVQVV